MEYILLLAVLLNIAATAYVGKLFLRREEYRVEFIPLPPELFNEITVDEPVVESQPEQQKEILQPEPTKQVKKTYSAWENRTNIPWVESPNPPQQPVSLTKKGPLERPDGFV